MPDQTDLSGAFDLPDYWEPRFAGPPDRAREVAEQYHDRDVPTRLAPIPAEADASAAGVSQPIADGGTGEVRVLFVDSLCARPTASDGPHAGLSLDLESGNE